MAEGEVDDNAGHRARLRKRLAEGGPDALLDHELVEYLLGLAIPRRDTKPLAKKLIREFGGFGALLSADGQALARIGGLSEGSVAAIKIAQASALRLLKSEVEPRPILSSWQALLDYLTADMAHNPVERVRVLYLNSQNMLIRDELVSEGSIDEAAVYVREVIRHALDYHAAALILVHNHPSGDPKPSKQDIAITRDIVEAGRHLKILVHDHIIIGTAGHSSLRSMGLL
ncbi:RadC family protein [Allosphingosinicella indica]|uniref:DNA repair protein RadC n=1 Tax=Allosphingosinicella indica TaxID=941907 RepID=A0A1X7H064_9SPHN|nr:DNA repair protein RadC [Allosphingosinicella indica]SMF77020.1 DNA repair protein RadC [Allosphingosinicella indica]